MSMNEWDTYAGRLLWAMRRAGKTNQSELARAVGVRPQSIQYLCDPHGGARGSSHTPSLARELGVHADWLAKGTGRPTDVETFSAHEAAPAYGNLSTVPIRETLKANRRGELAEEPSSHAHPGSGQAQLLMPTPVLGMQGIRVRGNGLAPYAKDGQFLVVQPADDGLQPQDNVVVSLKDGRVLIREWMAARDDGVLLLPLHGGQPEVIERGDIDHMALVVCVLPRRWCRGGQNGP